MHLRLRLPWMSRSDRRRWGAARTLGDLCGLTALWLTGHIRSVPGTVPNYGPDEETAAITPALVALCHAGVLTTWSQPGLSETVGGAPWDQRAVLEGFVRPGVVDRLVDAATAAGLIVIVQPPAGGPPLGARVDVTLYDGDPYTMVGHQLDRDLLRGEWSVVSDAAYAELATAVQLTLISPEFGPGGNRLWPILLTAVGVDPATVGMHAEPVGSSR
ncbi:DUF6919 domain-containing protein [Embleya hyalina]|uniref:DUF6919 domain-containing protein n=1 Tax=Embleya hyalina TaxID=516124 RepID=A0A401Z3Y9_9ACTN|nr:hypothetical protein [Embleya hyalina]GCE01564.1 hypothetical protein EHYA_09330 [Embleya hyalina]